MRLIRWLHEDTEIPRWGLAVFFIGWLVGAVELVRGWFS